MRWVKIDAGGDEKLLNAESILSGLTCREDSTFFRYCISPKLQVLELSNLVLGYRHYFSSKLILLHTIDHASYFSA